ncbi:MAG: VTT domain-containing protein [Pseudorhodobacter sp.]|nr:VTT domain-containing protein [Pseudorhodobacter sp.]
MFDPEPLISQYGLFAVFGTAAVEGDIAVMVAGALHQRGYFEFWPTVAAAMLGGWMSDLLIYGLARRYRNHNRAKAIVARARDWRFFKMFVAYPMLLALAIRFLPGVRTIGPVSLATATPLTPLRYVMLTGIAAFLWATALVLVGKGAWHALQRVFQHLHLPEHLGLGALIGLVLILSGVTLLKWRKRVRAARNAD